MIKIFLETGKKTTSEYVFTRTLLRVLGISESLYQIECVNGKDNLPHAANTFIANTLQGGTNLLIFDADTEQNQGGFAKRKQELTETLQRLGIEAEIFLFPNNQDDGDFETLVEQLTQTERHQRFFDCYGDYENCLGTDYIAPNRKGKLFTYISAMPMSKTQRDKLGQGEWHFDDPQYWDLNSPALEALKGFLKERTR